MVDQGVEDVLEGHVLVYLQYRGKYRVSRIVYIFMTFAEANRYFLQQDAHDTDEQPRYFVRLHQIHDYYDRIKSAARVFVPVYMLYLPGQAVEYQAIWQREIVEDGFYVCEVPVQDTNLPEIPRKRKKR
jgi:hypothetical protein